MQHDTKIREKERERNLRVVAVTVSPFRLPSLIFSFLLLRRPLFFRRSSFCSSPGDPWAGSCLLPPILIKVYN